MHEVASVLRRVTESLACPCQGRRENQERKKGKMEMSYQELVVSRVVGYFTACILYSLTHTLPHPLPATHATAESCTYQIHMLA